MVRTIRDSKLDTPTGRAKLMPAPNPYWLTIGKHQSIGYHKPKSGSGTWRVRLHDPSTGTFKKAALGTADDFQEADGEAVLSFAQAQRKAEEWFKEMAEQARRKLMGEPILDGKLTVNVALDLYLEAAQGRGMKSVSSTSSAAKLHIRPALGDLEVPSLTRMKIEAWHRGIADQPRQTRKSRFSSEPVFRKPPANSDEKRARRDTANRLLTILKAALNYVLDRGLVDDGRPWQAVKPFRGTTSSRVRFLTAQESVLLVNACPPEFRDLVKGALLTGCRYGELVRLQVRDLNPENASIFIAESKGVKPRHLVLSQEGLDLFRGLVSGKDPLDLIFQREGIRRHRHPELGNGWGPGDQTALLRQACKDAGIEHVSFHELRHTYASRLVNAGVPLAYVADQLGHADIRMVGKHYGHLCPSAKADAIRAGMGTLGIVDPPTVEALKIKRA